MLWTDDPVRDAYNYYEEAEMAARRIERPACQDCGNEIEEDHCYVMDADYPMLTCICSKCMERRLSKMPEALSDWMSDNLPWEETPTERREI